MEHHSIKTAIGSGGWSERDIFRDQSRLDFLPESQTDFIIAVLAEEWGLRGVLFLLLLYVLVVAGVCGLASRHRPATGGYWPAPSRSRLGFMWW